ncbi:MAG: DNA mismatch repair protein MutS [Clostridia bacterium]|nr:DNA mismatch repair protein MutS [Clostridia bacterium]
MSNKRDNENFLLMTTDNVDRTQLSSMMQAYIDLKKENKEYIILYRLGDFYEMFFEDAVLISRELELTLTRRKCGLDFPAPMCGVPYHAVDSYIAKLIQKGYKVMICEQSDKTDEKGLVVREVTRIITPGTVTESNMLTEDKNNYIAGIYYHDNAVGISWADISTGEFNHTYFDRQIASGLNDLLARIEPVEVVCNEEMFAESINLSIVKYGGVCPFTTYDESAFEYENAFAALKTILPTENISAIKSEHSIRAAGALLTYIQNMQKCAVANISSIKNDENDKYLIIDANARCTLELTKTLSNTKNASSGSLMWCLNRTKTGMGARMLRKWIEMPEIDVTTINMRLDFVEELTKKTVERKKLQTILDCMYDIERLTSRLTHGRITPDEFMALERSLSNMEPLQKQLKSFNCELAQNIYSNLPEFTEECQLIQSALQEKQNSIEYEVLNGKNKNAKTNSKVERIFKNGYDADADKFENLIINSNQILQEIVASEKEETGIKGLKIGFNNVFGYYLEVPNSQINLVPYRYTRKQTVTSGERYITEELKNMGEEILNAADSLEKREAFLYVDLKEKIASHHEKFQNAAKYVAILDCLVSFAAVAKENNYIKPKVNNGKIIRINEGRHPVVEKLLKDEDFVPNNTFIDSGDNKIMLITGPNMAGKSIYMKQVALISIMAQIGSFVPANSAEIGIVDKIFTRVGASDDLASGRSTFMVEMSEVSYILENATDNSLILMDEIGRGTSTFDGLSLAKAIIEHLSQNLNAKVLFSTHYHELTDLEERLTGIKNYKLTVKEANNTIVFLRKVMRGSANRSFGIEVASLSGLPNQIVNRAKEVLKQLENSELQNESTSSGKQISLFVPDGKTHEIVKILRELDTDNITPRTALDILNDLKEKATINE